ncbi:hypothetical protein KUCAC02_024123, partial [Chaenocephalus aceratus]
SDAFPAIRMLPPPPPLLLRIKAIKMLKYCIFFFQTPDYRIKETRRTFNKDD